MEDVNQKIDSLQKDMQDIKKALRMIWDVVKPKVKPEPKPRKKKEFNRPELEMVKEYFRLKGYREEIAQQAYDYYEANDWKDSQGRPILSWKQKMIGVWLRPEHKIQDGSQKSVWDELK